MENCLIECTFDGAWVLQESKKNILPVDVLVGELLEQVGGEAVTVLKKNYVGCRLVVKLPEGAGRLEKNIEEILSRHWDADEAGRVCSYSARALSEEEAEELLGRERKEAARKSARKEKLAAASDIPADKTARAQAESRRPDKGRAADGERKSALTAIGQLVGAEEFKKLAEEIAAVAPQIRRTGARRAFTSQQYLFAIGDGCGLTTALERLADLVEEQGLFTFSGKKRVMEWVIDAPSGEEADPLLKTQEFLRSRNHFKGVLCLDIRHWIAKTREPKFQRLLRAVGDAQGELLVVFRVPYMQADALESLRRGLSDVVATRSVAFAPFTDGEYGDYARRLLEECRFFMAEDAWPAFYKRLAEEKSGARFYGLDSVDKLVNEMIYRKLLNNAAAGTDDMVLAGPDVEGLLAGKDDAAGLAELDDMIGMESIRDRILEMVAQVQLQMKLADSGRSIEKPCLHMRFVGSPGTGKTTVARIVGKILKEKGILEVGNFYEVSGRSLCGRYVGETAPKTSEICRNAYGSVLFIDESYSLYAGDDNSRDYGKEAIDTLIAEMENNRDKMVVILSGYPDEMEVLMRANPGLAGRVPYEIRFPNYTKEQLTRIFLKMAGRAFTFDEPFEQAAAAFFGSVSDSRYKAKNFSNARLARNLYERVWAKAAVRYQRGEEAAGATSMKEACTPINSAEPIKLLPEDLHNALADKEFQQLLSSRESTIGFTAAPRDAGTRDTISRR